MRGVSKVYHGHFSERQVNLEAPKSNLTYLPSDRYKLHLNRGRSIGAGRQKGTVAQLFHPAKPLSEAPPAPPPSGQYQCGITFSTGEKASPGDSRRGPPEHT